MTEKIERPKKEKFTFSKYDMTFEIFINNEDRMVTAVLPKRYNNTLPVKHAVFKVNKKFVGVARCHKDDDFDRKAGIDLAVYRAMCAFISEQQSKVGQTAISLVNFRNNLKQSRTKFNDQN